MAGNILKAVIDVSAPGAKEAFAGVEAGSKKTEATLRQLTPAISKLGASLNALKFAVLDRKEELIRTTDIGRAKQLNVEIRNLEREIKRLQTSGTSSFGAIGASASKSFSGLRTLANILPGVGISGLVLALSTGLEKLAGTIFNLGRAYDFAAADAQVFAAANKAVGDDMARLGALVSIAQDVTQSTQARTNAISELQRLYPDYLRNISLETINSSAAQAAIDNLTRSIVSKAIAQAYSAKVAEESLKLSEKQDKVNTLIAKQGAAAAELLARRQTEPSNAVKKLGGLYEELSNKLGGATVEMNRQQEVVNVLTGKLKDATVASLEFVKTPKIPKVAKEAAFEFDALKQIFIDLVGISKVFADQISAGVKLRLNIQTDIGKGAGSAFDSFTKEVPKISSELQKEVDRLNKTNPITVAFNARIKTTDEAKAQIASDLKSVNDLIKNALDGAFSGIGESIGEALAGGDMKNIFGAFVNAIGQGVQAIGKQLITLGTVALAAKLALKQLFSNPALMIAAGIALVAVGSALNKVLGGGLKGFAQGGFTGQGGRNDPAGIVHRGEFVIPVPAVQKLGLGFLNQLAFGGNIRGFQNGGSVSGVVGGGAKVSGVVYVVQRGKDLIGTIDLAKLSQGRL